MKLDECFEIYQSKLSIGKYTNIRKDLKEMEQSNPKDKLLQSPQTVQMVQFPGFEINTSQSKGNNISDNKNFQNNKQQQIIPQIFLLGGNKQLNVTLYHQRQSKLSKISLSEPIIECQNLAKAYELEGEEQVVALTNITLKGNEINGGIKRGQFVIIRGPSGGGKTTFLNLLGTIDKSTGGHIWIDGERIDEGQKDDKLSKLRRDKIGIVFQTFNLLALMTAYENIELPMRIKGEQSEKAMKQRTKMLLKRVGLTERAEHLPSELSGGQQQRVAIARSLANSPQIILLDQPTGDLDSKSTVQVMNLLLEINNFGYQSASDDYRNGMAEGITIIMVTHNEDLECYGDRVIFFEDGKIKKQVFNDFQFALNAEEYSQFLNTKV